MVQTPASEHAPSLINVELEGAVLGALMMDNRALAQVVDMLEFTDFYEPLHQRIYQQIVLLVESGRPATFQTLRPYFEGDPAVVETGGIGYLASLTTTALIGLRGFARQVRDLAQMRRLVDYARKVKAIAEDVAGDIEPEARIAEAEALLNDVSGGKTTTSSYSAAQAWDATVSHIEAESRGEIPSGIAFTRYQDIRKIGVRGRPGDLIILAGRPGMGKTATALKISTAAAEDDDGVLYLSLEMSADQLAARIIADQIYDYGRSPSFEALQTGDLSAAQWLALSEARARIADMPLFIEDPATLNIRRLPSVIRRYQRRLAASGKVLRLVVVDYLQLMQGAPGTPRIDEVSAISRGLKSAAKECGVAIVALSQLSRKVEEREDKRPILPDLRESGQIEQDADVVAFVYREQHYLEQAGEPTDAKHVEAWHTKMNACRDKVEIYSAKVRQGKKGRRLSNFFLDGQAIRDATFFSDRFEHD